VKSVQRETKATTTEALLGFNYKSISVGLHSSIPLPPVVSMIVCFDNKLSFLLSYIAVILVISSLY